MTDAGTEMDTLINERSSTTSSGGWTYQYDLDGNLTERDNGTAEDCEKWSLPETPPAGVKRASMTPRRRW